jgi:uncharacterized protein YndB with AHSA1/START domain
MSRNIIAKAAITIEATASRVWEALTTPEMIKQYFFGVAPESDWEVGSPLIWKGEWEGKEFVDKGEILQSNPPRLFQYTYLSSYSGLDDLPENYSNITYELSEDLGKTELTVTQENLQDEHARVQSEKNWNTVLGNLKKILEEESVLEDRHQKT